MLWFIRYRKLSKSFIMNLRGKEIFNKSGAYYPEKRDEYLQMPIHEKRKLYTCGGSFVTLKDVNTIKNYKMHPKNESKSSTDVGDVPILDLTEAKSFCDKISVWQGDITTLECDAIVNAANEKLLGGGGVDGAIHRASGPLLVAECATLNYCEPGKAKITAGYNLPAKYVIHTVGPRDRSEAILRSCYNNSLNLMKANKLTSIAFPCIATGLFGYPNVPAAKCAVATVLDFLRSDYGQSVDRVIFTVFLDKDVAIYESLLQMYFHSLGN